MRKVWMSNINSKNEQHKKNITKEKMKNIDKWHKGVAQKALKAWTNNVKKMKEQHIEHRGATKNKEEKHEEQEEQWMAQVGGQASFYYFFLASTLGLVFPSYNLHIPLYLPLHMPCPHIQAIIWY
jgi:hypothetical protein